jgi:hypothetical protein
VWTGVLRLGITSGLGRVIQREAIERIGSPSDQRLINLAGSATDTRWVIRHYRGGVPGGMLWPREVCGVLELRPSFTPRGVLARCHGMRVRRRLDSCQVDHHFLDGVDECCASID